MNIQTKIVTILILVSLLSIPKISCAFTFDLWKSGMTKRQIYKIGEKKHVYFRDGGRSYDRHMVLQNKIEYDEKLLGENASVSLVFTNETNKLYSILIRWDKIQTRNKIDDLVATLRIELSKKYGAFSKKEGVAMSICNSKKCTGKTESYYFDYRQDHINIYYIKCNSCLSLSYIDTNIKKMYDNEMEREKFKKKLGLDKF